MIIKLILPNDMRCVSPVVSLVESLGSEKGFSKKESNQLQLAVEEALANVVQHAFEADNDCFFDVSIEDNTSGIEVVIKEMGIPFSLEQAPHFDPKKISSVEEATKQKGLGLYIISKMVDVFDQKYLGIEGKVTKIVKYQQNPQVTEYKHPEVKSIDRENVVVNMHKFEEYEALGVARCLYTAYGYTYLKTSLYNPEYIKEVANSTDYLIFTGSVQNGDIAAVCIAKGDSLFKGVLEVGSLVVSPNYRNMKLADKIMTHTIDSVGEIGVNGVFAECVTIHNASQTIMLRHGTNPCCILINRLPNTVVFKNIGELLMERQSLVCQYKELKGRTVNIYIPEIYRSEILKIYNRLGISVEEVKAEDFTNESCSEINAVEQHSLDTMVIIISKIGDDLQHKLESIAEAPSAKSLTTFYLYLPLNDAKINDAILAAKRANYIFSGIFTGVENMEYFLMQRIIKCDPCFDAISIVLDEDKWMIDLIKQEYNQLNNHE